MCEFAQHELHFLGHVISQGNLRMDEAKVQAIKEWEAPTKVTKLRSFLGLANYYRRFISTYSAKSDPLTELLKKNKPWVWSEDCKKAFKELKAAVIEEPILALPDFSKTFEVHTDASDYAIGGARWQDFLAEFDYELDYKPGKGNVVADALSKKFELAAITTTYCDIQDAIKDGLQHDPEAKRLMDLAVQGKTKRFWVEDGLLLTAG
ncbi:uncharacterized mitochondrial protein AtMg00860-like [Solanum dulcamara]|uniref:uncharacterized mitochondrial protein AtMg00860-like n=1 Tax=Solanum dulcamara TaxID=45834 RepID=UPI0024850C81|nr:uncharacterized mitochondrial protein AtMg00860-like [Solanum dulcamara]